MRKFTKIAVIVLSTFGFLNADMADAIEPPPANGIALPKNYKNWRVISVSHRNDKDSLRAIVGNHTAMRALRQGQTAPWPDGAVLGKLVWKDRQHPKWPDAIVPGDLSHIEFMVKNRHKYASTGGWGFARWIGMELKPYVHDGSECFACHTRVKNSDFVFTRPAPLP